MATGGKKVQSPCIFPFKYDGDKTCAGPGCCNLNAGSPPYCAVEKLGNAKGIVSGYSGSCDGCPGTDFVFLQGGAKKHPRTFTPIKWLEIV